MEQQGMIVKVFVAYVILAGCAGLVTRVFVAFSDTSGEIPPVRTISGMLLGT